MGEGEGGREKGRVGERDTEEDTYIHVHVHPLIHAYMPVWGLIITAVAKQHATTSCGSLEVVCSTGIHDTLPSR